MGKQAEKTESLKSRGDVSSFFDSDGITHYEFVLSGKTASWRNKYEIINRLVLVFGHSSRSIWNLEYLQEPQKRYRTILLFI